MHCTALQQTQIPPLHCHTFSFLLHCICTEIVLYHCNRPRSHTFAPTKGQLTKRLPVAFSSVAFELVYPICTFMLYCILLHTLGCSSIVTHYPVMHCKVLCCIALLCIHCIVIDTDIATLIHSRVLLHLVVLQCFTLQIDTSHTSALSVSQ